MGKSQALTVLPWRKYFRINGFGLVSCRISFLVILEAVLATTAWWVGESFGTGAFSQESKAPRRSRRVNELAQKRTKLGRRGQDSVMLVAGID